MSEFYDLLDEYIGSDDTLSEIRVVVRRLWKYDFIGYPLYIWQGKGKLITNDDQEWLGTITADNVDLHETPVLQDGRDGSSPTYEMTLNIPDLPNQSAFELYEEIKSEQSAIKGRKITCYLAVFKEGEGLRPQTPYIFFKQLNMMSPKFSEVLEPDENGALVRKYTVQLVAKDSNFGRSNTPRGTYADTMQKQRAAELGVAPDRGSEHLAALANRTYTIP